MSVTDFHGGYINPEPYEPSVIEAIIATLLRGVWWLVRTVWDYRYIVTIVAVVGSSAWFVDRRFLLILLLLALRRVRSWLRGELARSLERYRISSWRRNWNRYSMQLGWARRYNRRTHTPKLDKVTLAGDKTIIELQPLADHRIKQWAEMADSLRRLTNHAQATWREITPGHLEIKLHKQPLPTLLPLEHDLVGHIENQIYLGLRADGEQLAWDVDYSPHLLIAGTTGGGKGSACRLIAAHAISRDWDLIIVNPKRSGEFHWTQHHHATILRDLDETEQQLSRTVIEMLERQDTLDQLGVDTWHNQPWQRQVIIVDEAPTLLIGGDQKQVRTDIATHLGKIAAMGRSSGIHLALVAQRADTQALGQHGGQLRNNIGARIAVGALDQQGRQMLFGTLDPDIERTLTGAKGRALATQLTPDLPADTYPAQIAWTEQTKLNQHTRPEQRNDRTLHANSDHSQSPHPPDPHPNQILLPHPRPHHQNPPATPGDPPHSAHHLSHSDLVQKGRAICSR